MQLSKIATVVGLSLYMAFAPGLAVAAENAALLNDFRQNVDAFKQVPGAAAGQEAGGAGGGAGAAGGLGIGAIAGIAVAAALAIALAALIASDTALAAATST